MRIAVFLTVMVICLPAYAQNWGSFQEDSCVALGVRQYSSRIDVPRGSWEDACWQTPARIYNGSYSADYRAARCVNQGLFGMWGEFDVPDTSCVASWGEFRDSCRTEGVRQYSSVIVVPWRIDSEDACRETPAVINNRFYRAARCVNREPFGMLGEFDVPDTSCAVPYGSKMAFIAHEGYDTPGPYRYVRVRSDGSVYIAPIDGMTETDATNAEFKKVNGLSDSECISFESTKYPGRVLRHTNYEIRLEAVPWNPFSSFYESATFCLTTPRGGGYMQAYESFNMKDHFIRAEGSALVLRHVGSESQSADYDAIKFHERAGEVTLMLYCSSCGPGLQAYPEGEYQVVQFFGSCTGRAPLFGPAPTTNVGWWLEYQGREAPFPRPNRVVQHTAIGQLLVSYSPWIKFYVIPESDTMTTLDWYIAKQGYVAKITTGKDLCF